MSGYELHLKLCTMLFDRHSILYQYCTIVVNSKNSKCRNDKRVYTMDMALILCDSMKIIYVNI